MKRERYKGERIGLWTLVQHVYHDVWIAKCQCGFKGQRHVAEVVHRFRSGLEAGCRSCSGGRRSTPKLCRSCGTADRERFGKRVTECMACDRSAHRNGRHRCGRPIRKGRSFPHSVIRCECLGARDLRKVAQ